jgi:threonine aldolase
VNFGSDNWAGATPEVMASLARHNAGFAPGYGGDPLTASVGRRFAEVFDHEVGVYFTATGTGSNALSMAACARPGGLIFCSAQAHLRTDELGASEFFTQGMKLIAVPCRHGKIDAASLAETLAAYPEGNRTGQPTVLSLTNATESGTLYSAEEIAGLARLAHDHGLFVHLDGARFGNAVAALGVSPAALSWRAGVDIMSFGGTKNGCWAAEAILVFNPEGLGDLNVLKSRAGHTFSKARFVAAQFEAYLADGNWLKTADHANGRARRLAEGIAAKARLAWPAEANEVFPILPKAAIARLKAAGAMFYSWPAENLEVSPDEEVLRLVTSWATTDAAVDEFLALL